MNVVTLGLMFQDLVNIFKSRSLNESKEKIKKIQETCKESDLPSEVKALIQQCAEAFGEVFQIMEQNNINGFLTKDEIAKKLNVQDADSFYRSVKSVQEKLTKIQEQIISRFTR